MTAQHRERDIRHMRHAARLALRGHGGAEPNPMVGCVIVDAHDTVIGWGLHRRCGEAHAERAALESARSAGHSTRGATVYVTLEPCLGSGRTAPCVDALIDAEVARVVHACRDPHPKGRGGADALRAAGIAVELLSDCEEATALSAPFRRRVVDGRPWIVAKWAMTIDGRIASSSGDSQWISNPRSRAAVHRERGRVDAIITGIGTVLADDPRLTARSVRRRRVARRVVVDPQLRLPDECALLRTLDDAPLTIACATSLADGGRAASLRSLGVEVLALPDDRSDSPVDRGLAGQAHSTLRTPLDLQPLAEHLATAHHATVCLVEAGPRLVGSLIAQELVDEAWIFVAPRLLGDAAAIPSVDGLAAPRMTDASRWSLVDVRRRGEDVMLRYRSASASRMVDSG